MLNECTRTKHISLYLEESKGDSHTKAWEGPLVPKKLSSNLDVTCIPYKLYERLILMRISSLVDEKLTKDQAGFIPGTSCAGQLNLAKHIEDG